MYYLDECLLDHDRHGSGCDCGSCDGNGKAYGVSLYELDAEGIKAYLRLQAEIDAESFEAWVEDADPVDVYYAPSEEAAVENALLAAKNQGYLLVDHDPFVVTEQGPLWFLTNGLCESTEHWTPLQFERLGLSYQKDGPYGPYPLTQQEERLIAANGFRTIKNGILRLGYSVLWQDKKWLCATIEYEFEDCNDVTEYEHFSEEQARWQKILTPLDGYALPEYSSPLHDRYTLNLVVPFPVAIGQFTDYWHWNNFLKENDEKN